MAPILAVDTSSPVSFISVRSGEKIFTEQSHSTGSHNEEIDRLVKAVLYKSGLRGGELSKIVNGSGPGSFTGLRISSAYLKGLSYSLKVPLVQYSSLECPVYNIMNNFKQGVVCTTAFAGRGEYFVSIYEFADRKTLEVLSPSIQVPADILNRLKSFSGEIFSVFLGTDHPEFLSPYQNLKMVLSEALLDMHEAVSSGHSSKKAYNLQETSNLEPLYLRQVAAKTLEERGVKVDFNIFKRDLD